MALATPVQNKLRAAAGIAEDVKVKNLDEAQN